MVRRQHYLEALCKEGPGYMLSDFLVYIVENRKFAQFVMLLIAVPALVTLGVGVILWFIMRPTVESVGPQGQGSLRLKMGAFAPEVYISYVHPRGWQNSGWQNTGVLVSPGDVLRVNVHGETTVGLDVVTIGENAKKARKWMDQVQGIIDTQKIPEEKAIAATQSADSPVRYEYSTPYGWPWINARGYDRALPARLKKIPSTFPADTTLLSPKYPSGCLIGYIGRNPQDRKQEHIIDFTGDDMGRVHIPGNVEKNAPVFLAINDSDLPEWQYDNFGFLIVTIERR
jgi:hypothetical protein